MPQRRKIPRNTVSFTKFRQMQLLAVKRLWSCLWTSDNVDETVHFLIWGLVTALEEARFADAVALSRSLAEQQYGDARSYRLGAQIVALVKKVPFSDPSLDPESAALTAFWAAEADCGEINKVFRDLNLHFDGHVGKYDESKKRWFLHTSDVEEPLMVQLLLRARAHLHRVLGPRPDVQTILRGARFGSGSSVGVHGNATHFLRKISKNTWTVSPLCLPYAEMAAAMAPAFWYALGMDPAKAAHLWDDRMAFYKANGPFRVHQPSILEEFKRRFRDRVELVSDDLITYVPKDADRHRTVGTQPLLNSFCQLGVGDYLKGVLRDQCGIVLEEDQKDKNGPLAFLASWCNGTTLATIDLSSASDTIAKQVVKFLIPQPWYVLLNSLRTPSFKLPYDEISSTSYEKFCAMGNGFCFPLETLVFWSLVQAVYDVVEIPDRLCAVYGDDIIVYQPAALLLIELLEACGFKTNVSKTFIHGPFRESCGQDYFNGINVRPVVLDEVIEGLGQAYHFINSLQRKGYSSLAADLRELLPPDAVHMRPYPGDTTTALEVPMDTFMASRHARFKRVPSDEKKPYYHAWSWVELLPTPVLDETEYDEGCELSAVLLGATPVDYKPAYALRRKTRVREREVALG